MGRWGIRWSHLKNRIIVSDCRILKEFVKWIQCIESSEIVTEIVCYSLTASWEEIKQSYSNIYEDDDEWGKYLPGNHIDRVDISPITPKTVPGVTLMIGLEQIKDLSGNVHGVKPIKFSESAEENLNNLTTILLHCREIEKIQIQNNFHQGTTNILNLDFLKAIVSSNRVCSTTDALNKLCSINSSLRQLIFVNRTLDRYAHVNIEVWNKNAKKSSWGVLKWMQFLKKSRKNLFAGLCYVISCH